MVHAPHPLLQEVLDVTEAVVVLAGLLLGPLDVRVRHLEEGVDAPFPHHDD
jgi:hypothetical protein